ncbi:MAG TPA: ABC transporter substrate-binding protein [Thermoanaerobaculia bacterium]|nr:ABC transporter substrate-binding protein [Thermoanaerobaculia bacterium]
MTHRVRFAVSAAALLAIAVISSCRSERRAPARTALLRIGQLTSGVTLDPHRHDSYYTNVTLGQVYEKLVTLGRGFELLPELAEGWESPSETVWRFHLKRGVVFHDGSPFGAEDVVASLKRAAAPESHVRHYLQSVADVRAVDAFTVDVVTKRPAPVLLNDLAFVMIVPRATGPQTIDRPIGTGPFAYVSGKAGGTIAARRFARWHGPAPAFEAIEIVSLPDARQRARAIDEGRADLVAQFPPEDWDGTRSDPRVRLISRPGVAVDFLFFSARKGSPFADLRVRRAIALAVDKEDVVRSAFHGLGAPANEIVPPSVFGYAAGLPAAARDVAAARRLLAEAGYERGLSAQLVTSARVEPVGRAVARQLAEAGVTLSLEVLPQNEFYERFSREQIPLALHSYGASTGDAANTLEAMLHSRRDGYGTFNASSFASPLLDDLIERAGQELAPAVRRGTLEAAMRLVSDEVPVVPLAVRNDLYALRSDLVWTPAAARLRAIDVRPAR